MRMGTHPAITTPEMFIAAMAGQVSSPTLKATSGGAFLDNDLFDPEWEQFEMRERVRKDHDQAANRATYRQWKEEKAASALGMSVEEHMRLRGTLPGMDYKSRPIEIPTDEMAMSYMRANAIACNNQRRLEKTATQNGMTVEDYMDSKGMLTDTHLTPWAR